nr:phosphotransferase [Deltaproteobacteria bacterium]
GGVLPLSSEELAVFSEPIKELPFVNLHRFLTKLGVRVPTMYGQWPDEGLLLLEDLGDQSLWDTVQGLSSSEVFDWYRRAIDQLLDLQIKGTRARDESCMAFKQKFDFRLYMWEFEHFLEYGMERGEKGSLKKKERDSIRSIFTSISRHLEKQTPYLNHRDYHSWNLMARDGDLIIIDFQDALMAPIQYDLASLLNDRDTDSIIQPELEGRLIDYYLNRAEDLGEKTAPKDEFMENYLLSALQRDLKVVGRFYYLDLVKGKPHYKRYIPITLKRIKRHLTRLPGQKNLLPLLAPHFPELQ